MTREPDTPEEGPADDEGIPDGYVVTTELDLHGFFPEQIEEVVNAFIDHARTLELKELRIIHGKGKSRLKWEVHQVLKNHEDVETFSDAPPGSGGWGATRVRIK